MTLVTGTVRGHQPAMPETCVLVPGVHEDPGFKLSNAEGFSFIWYLSKSVNLARKHCKQEMTLPSCHPTHLGRLNVCSL